MPTATKKVDAWFDWPDDPDGARVHFRLLTDQDVDAIKAASHTHRQYFDRESGTFQIELKIDNSIDRRETALRATLGWEHFYDGDRKPMECTRDSVAFWSCDPDFMAFLYSCQIELRKTATEQLEAARKNS